MRVIPRTKVGMNFYFFASKWCPKKFGPHFGARASGILSQVLVVGGGALPAPRREDAHIAFSIVSAITRCGEACIRLLAASGQFGDAVVEFTL